MVLDFYYQWQSLLLALNMFCLFSFLHINKIHTRKNKAITIIK